MFGNVYGFKLLICTSSLFIVHTSFVETQPIGMLAVILNSLQSELKNLYEYIYIPKDIDPEVFTQLETKEIQSLMDTPEEEKLKLFGKTINALHPNFFICSKNCNSIFFLS